jgi:cobalamin biosynthesis Mg chelatase CobN
VALETRTRMLNPKWYEGMLKHGYEGVRQIEVHVTNTMGWSATTGQVQPWVYQQLTETFMLDPAMRERLATAQPTASARVANRLLEAIERQYWQPDDKTLEALRRAGEELEDRLEGVYEGCRMNDIVSVPLARTQARRAPRPRPARRRGQRAGAARPEREDRHRQGVRHLRQGRHRQEHHLSATCRGLSASSASACCRSAATPSTTAPSR